MILSNEEMQRLEEKAFEAGVTAEALMDDVGLQAADVVSQFFPVPGSCRVYPGKGNNGGDVLVAAKHLAARGWEVTIRLACFEQELGMLPKRKLREVRQLLPVSKAPIPEVTRSPFIILDGLLGLGASGMLRDNVRQAAHEINELRVKRSAHVFAMDIPTGLLGEGGMPDPDCVRADFTLAAGYAKTTLLQDFATAFVGRLAVLPLAQLDERLQDIRARPALTRGRTLGRLLPRRSFDTHKTNFGRVGIVAGSQGMTGAAVLCATGALRAGAGLVTAYVMENAYPIVAAMMPPEIMVRPISFYREVLGGQLDVLAVGPGLGTAQPEELLHLIQDADQPMVVDADALNVLPKRMDVLHRCVGQRLLTPHPGEMARLCGNAEMTRLELVEWFTLQFPVTLMLKGARTIIAEKGKRTFYNSTGHPGMATGGMGDVLTGVCAALVAQSLSPHDAARTGAWLCGRAAEVAIYSGAQSQESLMAGNVLGELGEAFAQMRAGCY